MSGKKIEGMTPEEMGEKAKDLFLGASNLGEIFYALSWLSDESEAGVAEVIRAGCVSLFRLLAVQLDGLASQAGELSHALKKGGGK